ncbi:MAG: hypothetical protein RLY86_1383 [Pseudomonadota bacterium]|jgi:hypothetical protein
MAIDRTILAAAAAAILGGFLLSLLIQPGKGTDRAAGEPPVPAEAVQAAPVPAGPVEMAVGPVFVPVWHRGRVVAVVAAEMVLRLTDPADPGDLPAAPDLPVMQDRFLAVLIRAGAEGRLDPGRTDAAGLEADLLAMVRSAGAPVTAVRLSRLIHQDRRPAAGGGVPGR